MDNINLSHRGRFSGHYTLRVHGGDRPEQVLDFHNMVLDSGINGLLGGDTVSTLLTWCDVGTSNVPPARGQTGLVARIAGSSTRVGSDNTIFNASDPANPYYEITRITRFAAGQATGNIAEVGCGGGSGKPYWSRALVVDSNDQPTVISVLPNEILDVTYKLRWYIDVTDATGSFVLGGNTYNYVCRPHLKDRQGYHPWYSSMFSSTGPCPSPRTFGSTFTSLGDPYQDEIGLDTNTPWHQFPQAYVTSSFKRAKLWGSEPGRLPTGVINAVRLTWGDGNAPGFAHKMQFTPPIPFNVTQTIQFTLEQSVINRT